MLARGGLWGPSIIDNVDVDKIQIITPIIINNSWGQGKPQNNGSKGKAKVATKESEDEDGNLDGNLIILRRKHKK